MQNSIHKSKLTNITKNFSGFFFFFFKDENKSKKLIITILYKRNYNNNTYLLEAIKKDLNNKIEGPYPKSFRDKKAFVFCPIQLL